MGSIKSKNRLIGLAGFSQLVCRSICLGGAGAEYEILRHFPQLQPWPHSRNAELGILVLQSFDQILCRMDKENLVLIEVCSEGDLI